MRTFSLIFVIFATTGVFCLEPELPQVHPESKLGQPQESSRSELEKGPTLPEFYDLLPQELKRHEEVNLEF